MEIAVFEGGESVWRKFSGRKECTPPIALRVAKTRCIELYGIRMWEEVSLVFSQSTRITDRRTDRQTGAHRKTSLHAAAVR